MSSELKPIGVLYAPFQIATLTERHKNALNILTDHHAAAVVALPVKRFPPTKKSPLDFRTRAEMIQTDFPRVQVVPVPDQKYPNERVAALEKAVYALFSNRMAGCLYGESDFLSLYTSNGGKWLTTGSSLIYAEQEQREALRMFPPWPMPIAGTLDIPDLMEFFRKGAIYTMQAQYPASIPTVDIAIIRRIGNGIGGTYKEILLGRKPAERKFRFPGGYKDRSDNGWEVTAGREGAEEALRDPKLENTSFLSPEYIGSMNVADWRYDGEEDGITTTLYEIEFVGDADDIDASDDIAEVRWFPVSEVTEDTLEAEHIPLWRMYAESLERH